MELNCCIHSPTLSSIPRSVLSEKPFLCGPTSLKLPAHSHNRTCPGSRNLYKFLDLRAAPSGTTKIKSQAQDSTFNNSNQKDGDLVFVAGATGKVGSRTVRELLKLGFRVRAGVRSIQRAQSLVQSVENMKLEDVTGGAKPIDNFELVECDLENLDRIRPSIGKSSVVICCIGASEKEILDITGPYRIDFKATKNLIDAATSAKVEHFILLTSLGTNKVGFPAAILNLFWGVLLWKRKAEEALLASGLPYTIVRPGGMERPTDSYKETHNITLSEEDTLFGGQVSNLQVAELLAFMAKSRSLSCCKVVEVIAETSAPLTPLGELLKKIPSQREDFCSFKESDDLDAPSSVAPSSTEKKPEEKIATKATPSSPYFAYEDLKPPTSPTPTPGGPTKAIEVNSSEKALTISSDNVRKHASSPYAKYEDLKPPSSPTPIPSGSKKEPSSTEVTLPLTVGNNNNNNNNDVAKTILSASSNQSPYLAYENLKPPSSPTPSAPVLQATNNIKPVENPDEDKSSGRPLSPYAMYEDLKPPSSPRKL